MQTVAEKLEAERQYETFIERVKIQLVEKTKDFELLREKLIPHDIDQLRIKVQEELEIQHKQQLQSMEQELGIIKNYKQLLINIKNNSNSLYSRDKIDKETRSSRANESTRKAKQSTNLLFRISSRK